MKTLPPFAFNIALFAGIAFQNPFLVLYFQSLGFTGAQIGLLAGIGPVITLLAVPLWTGLADARHRHKLVMSAALLMGAVSVAALGFFDSFVPILAAVILLAICFSPVTSFADSATMFMLAARKEMYGRVRLGGTFGYAVAASLAGLVVQNYGLKFAFWGCALIWFIALILSQKLNYSPVRVSGSTVAGMRDLLANRRWLLFLAIAFVGGFGFSAMANYFLPLMKQVGANESTMGIALTIGTVAEVPIFFFGNTLLRRLKPSGLLMLAVVMTAVRMLLYVVSTAPEFVLFSQLLNGFTFPAMWLAGVAYADQHAPAGKSASAQGMFGTMVFGVGPAVGGFIGGPLLESIGARGLYLVFTIVVLATLALVAFLQKRLPPEKNPAAEMTAQ